MMAKETLFEKIKQKGIQEAEAIKEEGRKQGFAHYEKLINDAKNQFNDALNKAKEKQKMTIAAKELSTSRALRNEQALAKQALIDNIFKEIKAYLQSLKGEPLFNYVKQALSKETIQGDETIKVSKKDYETYRSILSTKTGDLVECDLLNKALGSKFNLKLSKEPVDIESGFMVIGSYFDLNFSYEETLEHLIEKFEKEIYEAMN